MQSISSSDQLKSLIRHFRQNQPEGRLALVPTMGALHAGHMDLVQEARGACECLVVSIFVNPLQFNKAEDLQQYPCTLAEDIAMLEPYADYIFCPSVEEMYPTSVKTKMDFGPIDTLLEGQFRPGHFSGVGVVVSKLFHIVQPDQAYFGQKDIQQVEVIKQMVRDLSFPIEIITVPTSREASGLARSSRNARLNTEEKKEAAALCACLQSTRARLLQGESFLSIQEDYTNLFLQNPIIELEYLELVNFETLERNGDINNFASAFVCIAAQVGPVRLIDNIKIKD